MANSSRESLFGAAASNRPGARNACPATGYRVKIYEDILRFLAGEGLCDEASTLEDARHVAKRFPCWKPDPGRRKRSARASTTPRLPRTRLRLQPAVVVRMTPQARLRRLRARARKRLAAHLLWWPLILGAVILMLMGG